MGENPMAALAYQAYESVKHKIMRCVDTEFGPGKLVLLGGIQINMPKPLDDHFLPLFFEMRQKGMPDVNLLDSFKCVHTQNPFGFGKEQNEAFHMQQRRVFSWLGW